MRAKPSVIPSVSELSLPARDLVRGLQTALRRASKAFDRDDARLPAPFRQASALSAQFAQDVFQPAFELARLLRLDAPLAGGAERAAAELSKPGGGGDAAALFARSVGYGLEFGIGRLGSDRLMVSRTLADAAYRSALARDDGAAPQTPAARAARLCLALLRHRVAARAPGTPLGMTDADRETARVAAFAATLWLLVERDAPQHNEDEILALCVDVASSLRAEIAAGVDSETALGRLLEAYAGVI